MAIMAADALAEAIELNITEVTRLDTICVSLRPRVCDCP